MVPPAPAPAPGPATSPFARIAAFTGQAAETPAAPDPAPEPAVHPETPTSADFGRSFGLPSSLPSSLEGATSAPQPKPFGDGVSFGDAPRPLPPPVPVPTTPAPAFPPTSPFGAATKASEGPSGDCVNLGLASVVKGCAPQDIGISPDLIPGWVQTTLPLSLIRPQLGSGKVTLRIADILRGLEPEMRHLIVPARPDLEVSLPANDIFHALPVTSAVAAALPQPVKPAEPEPSAKLPSGVPWPFETKAEEVATPAVAPAPAPVPEVAPAPVPLTPAPVPALFAPASTEPSPASVSVPFAGFSAAPTPPSSGTAKGPSLPRVPRDSDKHRQMLLRVLLGSQDDDFDAEGVVRLTTGQPGVAAAVCFLDGRSVASAGNGSTEADNFLRQAQRMLEHVQPLVALTGIEDTETVSVKSDRHVVTFSLQGQVTLAVLHDPLQVESTLREKVTLIARELTGLLQAA